MSVKQKLSIKKLVRMLATALKASHSKLYFNSSKTGLPLPVQVASRRSRDIWRHRPVSLLKLVSWWAEWPQKTPRQRRNHFSIQLSKRFFLKFLNYENRFVKKYIYPIPWQSQGHLWWAIFKSFRKTALGWSGLYVVTGFPKRFFPPKFKCVLLLYLS